VEIAVASSHLIQNPSIRHAQPQNRDVSITEATDRLVRDLLCPAVLIISNDLSSNRSSEKRGTRTDIDESSTMDVVRFHAVGCDARTPGIHKAA
jgi:hypothetical protein